MPSICTSDSATPFTKLVCSLYLVFEHLDLDLKRYMDENKDTFNRNHRLIKVRHPMPYIT